MKTTTKMVVISLIAVFFIILDRWFKAVAINILAHGSLPITDWLKLSLDYNPYIAFSLPVSGWLLNILITIIAIILIAIYLYYKKRQLWLEAGWLFMIILGALSNLYDRWRYQAVVDYINISWFTVFNLADILICWGILNWLYLEYQRSKNQSA